jgi:hypothetical protein
MEGGLGIIFIPVLTAVCGLRRDASVFGPPAG